MSAISERIEEILTKLRGIVSCVSERRVPNIKRREEAACLLETTRNEIFLILRDRSREFLDSEEKIENGRFFLHRCGWYNSVSRDKAYVNDVPDELLTQVIETISDEAFINRPLSDAIAMEKRREKIVRTIEQAYSRVCLPHENIK